jgi:hypothetical protein
MTAAWLFPVLALGLLGVSVFHAWHAGDGDPLFLVTAAGYALAMEAVQRLFLSYQYVDFAPRFLDVPLIVPLGWAGVWYVAATLGSQVGARRSGILVPALGGLVSLAMVTPVDAVGMAWGWWRWGEQPVLLPFQAFSAGFTFLLGYGLVARMGLTGRVRARVRFLMLILTLAPLLFIHAQAVYLVRELLVRLS